MSETGQQTNSGLYSLWPEELHDLYKSFGLDIPKFNGDDTWELPMPGTYVLDKDGTVKFAFANADYTKES